MYMCIKRVITVPWLERDDVQNITCLLSAKGWPQSWRLRIAPVHCRPVQLAHIDAQLFGRICTIPRFCCAWHWHGYGHEEIIHRNARKIIVEPLCVSTLVLVGSQFQGMSHPGHNSGWHHRRCSGLRSRGFSYGPCIKNDPGEHVQKQKGFTLGE